MAEPRVVVYSRQGCHLCDEALDAVAAVCGPLGQEWAVVDIDGDADLRARWSDDVPVVTVDGVALARWSVDGAALRRALV